MESHTNEDGENAQDHDHALAEGPPLSILSEGAPSEGSDSRSTVRPMQIRYNTETHLSVSPLLSSRSSFRSGYRSPRKRSATTISVFNTPRSPRVGLQDHVPAQSEWSLFGSVMDSEGGRSRFATPLMSSRSLRASVPPSGTDTPLSVHVDEPVTESTVQSPISDHDMPDPFEQAQAELRHDPSSSSSIHYDYDSDSDDSSHEAPTASPKRAGWSSYLPTLTLLQRNILKCAIAYFIGSLFTFSPYLSGFISDVTSAGERRPAPSGHMVATVAVYFNPAKTTGAMLEADSYFLMGLLYASFVCLSSMSMFWWLEVQPGWEWLANVLVILWIGASMSAMAWMKVWLAKPSFNPACSMTAIILFVVIVKEGGVQTLLQVAFIVTVGACVSNVICYTLWPQSAMSNLQDNMIKTLDSFTTLLEMMTSTFLFEDTHQPSRDKLQKAVDSHQASFTSLKKNLGEARSEWLFDGPSRNPGNSRKSSAKAYQDAVDSLNRLAQHLNGLRSGIGLQYDLAKAHRHGKVLVKSLSMSRKLKNTDGASDTNGKGKTVDMDGLSSKDSDDAEVLKAAAEMFGDLVDDLGPPLKALTDTCATSLRRLKEAFVQRQRRSRKESIRPTEFTELTENLERALFTFESTSNHAVIRLYRRNESAFRHSRSSVNILSEDNMVLTGTEHENVFLVYFFIFTLQEFARELVSLVDAMSRIYSIDKAKSARGRWKALSGVASVVGSTRLKGRAAAEKRRSAGLRNRISMYIVPEKKHTVASFPKVRPHAPNTIQTPAMSDLSTWGKIKQTLWAVGSRMRERDIKYAIKAGMATAMLAAPAFFDATRPIFMEYRGEWALISFFVVISPTIGATNNLAVHRILGTLFGAGVASTVWTLFPENPVVLPIFGFFYSIPCFYYIVSKPQYATTGRFVLLTYNLTCLYCYNIRQRETSVLEIAFRRSVAVIAGVVWAFIVSRFWWPAEARRELSKALGDFCLNLGWLYTRLVASNSYAPDTQDDEDDDDDDAQTPPTEETALLTDRARKQLSKSIREFMAMELHLQIKLIEMQGLLAQTQHEPRLKGPFPVKLYRNILTSLQSTMDKLHSMRCVTTREEWFTTVRHDFIMPVNRERRDMVGNIVLYFSTLSSAFRLKAPLPPYLPPAEKSRQQLVDAIRKLDIVKNRDVKGSRQLLFFAYALTMKGVTQELEYLGRTLQDAFGVIGQTTEEFEAMFRYDAAHAV
ncbi:hypothetical protein OE88DRAFT_1655325 [Heliocybe sulcata]|uniref:Uncharacterized protein n=1 Tax=Heliocybe sulcata TaxID=5364 RepID=A0A5C3NBB0_9AGAM|nr:hypothetical protein OE88DRAFT_1655325 [Heliocybe sulcata]